MEVYSMNVMIRSAMVVSAALSVCGGALAQTEKTAARLTYEQTLIDAQNHKQQSGGPLIDHGGLVLPSSKTYAIYWGNAGDFPADLQLGMASLLGGFNGSPYLGIAQQYMRDAAISSLYAVAFSDISAPPVRAPSTAEIGAEVCKIYSTPDPSAIYFVFTSNAPKINYCAWHDKATCNGITFQVAYVPNQAQLPGCSPYVKSNLHCNTWSNGTVASADSVAHEFMEAITDAHIDAWFDARGAEIGDKCNFNYQACVNLPTGTWQIQSQWSNAINGCQQQ
jgi:hypothetical protein